MKTRNKARLFCAAFISVIVGLTSYVDTACASGSTGITIPDLVEDAYKQVSVKGSGTLLGIAAGHIGEDGTLDPRMDTLGGWIEFSFRVGENYWDVVYSWDFESRSKLEFKIEPSSERKRDPQALALSKQGIKKLEKLPSVFFSQAKAMGAKFPVEVGVYRRFVPTREKTVPDPKALFKPVATVTDVITIEDATGKWIMFDAHTEDILD